jgi:hypothetical protein
MASQGLYEITLREEFARMNELTGSLTLTTVVTGKSLLFFYFILYVCLDEFFWFNWFGKNPPELLINPLKYFRFWFGIQIDIQILGFLCILKICTVLFCLVIFSECVQFCSVYSKYTLNFILCILQLYTVQDLRNSLHSVESHRFIPCFFSMYTYSFIPHIISVC